MSGFNHGIGESGWNSVYGWGQTGLTPYQKLLKSATWAIDFSRPQGVKETDVTSMNTRQINPVYDLVGKVGKNLFDPSDILSGYYDSSNNGSVVVSSSYRRTSTFIPIQSNNYILKQTIVNNGFIHFYNENKIYISSAQRTDMQTWAITPPVNAKFMRFHFDYFTVINFELYQLELGTTATAYEPYKSKQAVFLNLDGVNSFGQFTNMDVLNPVGTDDFVQLVVFRPDDTNATRFFGILRNLDTVATSQYGLNEGSGGSLFYTIEGTSRSIGLNTVDLQYVLFGRINGERFAIRDAVQSHTEIFNGSLTSRANTQMACRSNSVDGTAKTNFGKGLQGDIFFWKGAQGTLNKAKIVDLAKKAMKFKYNLGS
jgi:hypothetical protein